MLKLQVLKVAKTQVNLEEISNLLFFFTLLYLLVQNNNFKSFATDSLAEPQVYFAVKKLKEVQTWMSFANYHQLKHLKKYRP